MWKTSTVSLFGIAALLILCSVFYYYNGLLTYHSTQRKRLAHFYESSFDSIIVAHQGSIEKIFKDSLIYLSNSIERIYLDSIAEIEADIETNQYRINQHSIPPSEVTERQKRKSNNKITERTITLKSYDGIYEDPTTKVRFFAEAMITGENGDVKLTYSYQLRNNRNKLGHWQCLLRKNWLYR